MEADLGYGLQAAAKVGCRVIRPVAFHVPEGLPLALLALVRSGWGEAAARAIAPDVRRLRRDQLHRAITRARYVRKVEELFAGPSFDLRIVRQDELIRRAISSPLRCWGLYLTFRSTHDRGRDEREIDRSLPWLPDIAAREELRRWLLRSGWVLLALASADEADRLYRSVVPRRVSPVLLDPAGRRIAGG